MNRRRLLKGLGLGAVALAALGGAWLGRPEEPLAAPKRSGETIERLEKSKEQWRRLLDREPYLVLFEEKTERPFSSPLNDEKRPGTYVCAACFLPLFDAKDKFDSKTGWPSFTQPLPGRIGTKQDRKLFVTRTEYHCIRCGGHQGHVFDDGPRPTGQRWCNNGVALLFVPKGEDLPPLRT